MPDVKVSQSCFIGGNRYREGDVIKGYEGELKPYMVDISGQPKPKRGRPPKQKPQALSELSPDSVMPSGST